MTEENMHADITDEASHQHVVEQDHQMRHDWIATYAYFLAEARGFTPTNAIDDWLAAERVYMEEGLAKGESD